MATSRKPQMMTEMTEVSGNVGPGAEAAWEGHGWWVFASIVLLAAGVMRLFDSIWAFRYHGAIPSDLEAALFGHSLSTYGWVYLGVAIFLFLTGIAVMTNSQIARWLGVAAGAVGTISAIWWMPYYPVWSLTYVALGVLVIWALAAHDPRGRLTAA